jgi:hypothetical protein
MTWFYDKLCAMRRTFSDEELLSKGLKPNGAVKKTLRHNVSMIAARLFAPGDSVIAIDKTASPYGRLPNKITVGKVYKVLKVKDCIIQIKNDSGRLVNYYANRFKKAKDET